MSCPTDEAWQLTLRKEMDHVTNKRLTLIDEPNDDVKRRAMPLRMILEKKRDGRHKGRLILQGFHEPRSYDRGAVDSPVAYILICLV